MAKFNIPNSGRSAKRSGPPANFAGNPADPRSESTIRALADFYIIPDYLNSIRDEWAALLSNDCLISIAEIYNNLFSKLGPGSYPEGAVTHFSLDDFQISPSYQTNIDTEMAYAKVTPPGDKSGPYCVAYAVAYNSQKEYRVFSLIKRSGIDSLDVYTIDCFGSFNHIGIILPGRSWIPALMNLAEKPMEVCASETMEYEEDGYHCIATWIPSAGVTNIERYDKDGECVGIETVSGKLFPFF